MTATLTLDEDGRLTLPDPIKRVFGIKPGVPLRAEVSEGRLEILCDDEPDLVSVDQLVEADGALFLPKKAIPLDAAAEIRSEREALANRAMCQ